jgi:hypothetical protein
MKNPYTENDNRLADVIAAIQVMATYKFYKLELSEWAKRIEGDKTKSEHWKEVFEQHPEFFRLGGEKKKASLVWRRNYQKLYNVDLEEKVSREAYKKLNDKEKTRYSRIPLHDSDISTLINTAINLHSSEIDHKQDARWWVAIVSGLIGIIVGSLIKAFV